jgi:hypothetical protein
VSGNVITLSEWRDRKHPPARHTYTALSGVLGRSVRQLKRDRALGMPVAVVFSGRLLFDEGECREWLDERKAA